MKAFDTDILTEILSGNPAYDERIRQIAPDEQAVPIVVIEEIIRGRFNVIRQAAAGKARVTIDRAYLLLEQTLLALREVKIVSFTDDSETLLQEWRTSKVKGSTRDLRIAASCLTAAVTLVSRNRRDFKDIPGLSVEFWD